MAVVGFTKLEALFRDGASLDIRKGHAKDVTDIVEKKLLDLLIAGERNANLNGRDVIWEADIPITKGFQESIIEFKKLENALNVEDILEYLTTVPPLKYPLDANLEAKLPEITGALLLILARVIKEVNNGKRDVNHEAINKAKDVLDLTL